jgi:tetratricopeptide (TPR) repeat protein
VYYRIGQIALGQKRKQKAQDSFKKGLKFALAAYAKQKNKYGNNLTTGMRAADIGAFYDQLKQKDKALEFLQLAHQLLKKYGENQPELAERISRHIKKLQK